MSDFKFRNLTILIISPEPWGDSFVSKHHYARLLARLGNTVVFLSSDGSTCQLYKTGIENLYRATYKPFFRGIGYFPSFLRRSFQKRKLKPLEKRLGKAFDVVWSFDSSVFYDLDSLGKDRIKIAHLVDISESFKVVEMALSADLCLGISDQVVDRFIRHNPETYKVRHGYSPVAPTPLADPLPGENKVKALYVGNLSRDIIDWETIGQTIHQNPDVDFLFMGPEGDNLGSGDKPAGAKLSVMAEDNFYKLPPVPSEQIMSFLSQADILMVVYVQDDPVHVANPHKMLEYLASGKPIVSTHAGEYAHLQDLIFMTDTNGQYADLFTSVVRDLRRHSAEERMKQRIDYAMSQTYEDKLNEIESHIGHVLSDKK
ncbi:hypothetical protein AB9P05_05800 [Roseivirga sp. BDSF3-8]|uniref:hypothetical protein n=1 Tax=Roseivirga sp. BDSF3-8 TaxID=3241598 RepID=UPI003531A368